ncbi:MAG: hypothetical protein EVB12_06670, partial [Winogradskyella sp.]
MRIKYIFIFLISFTSFSQSNYENMLERVSSKTQANVFIKRFKSEVKAEVINITSEDTLYGTLNLSESKKGDTKSIDSVSGKIIYKILGKTEKKSTSYNASIMEFDSNKITISEINSLRSFILKGIKNGEHKFENLARVYSSHPSAKTGGGLGWTKEGTFSKRFEKAIADKRVGQVFSFDEHRENKHYVIVKTEESKNLESITVL